ncbi:protease Lon-related BREX system protein BrxL [Blautia sp. HCP28S3_G10]|uniref:protease Lon-related BREX system protein BrxL n=1 Tax=Blautia sp. HCP28S3_G10 TaxID=3438908 RepID=UPI003F8CA594
MEEYMETGNTRDEIKRKLRDNFDGYIVRKDLTKSIREGANVPVYVLEYLLGQYCNSDDQEIIDEGIENVKRILRDNYVRPDEAQKILSLLREHGSYTIIDKITVVLNTKEDRYEAAFSNLGIKNIPIHPDYVKDYDRLLCGGIWCILRLEYEFIEEDKKNSQPIRVRSLKPIQMPHIDMDDLKSGRKAFTKEEWIDVILRTIGMEPEKFTQREKWLLLARMVPLVENNYNLCELGPRSTGKSYVYEQISPNSILVAGGQTTVANLFYNMSNNTVGLVGMWDVVAFDEVAGIKFKDKDGVQIMKGYMASGSFSRGKAEIQAKASMVFVGNINQSVETLLKTSSLFDPFPPEMGLDTAFLDRMHSYVPGWEIPKYRPDFFTDDYGFITDYLSEFLRELRKDSYSDLMDKYFKLGNNLNQRDTIAVRKTVSGLIKLVYPDGEASKDEVREIVELALELRRRVKEQLKKIGGMEFYDVNFSYIDNEDFEERYVSVPESGGGKMIPEGMGKPGSVYTVGRSKTGMVGCYHLETQMMPGNGKLTLTGLGTSSEIKQGPNTAFNYLKANGNAISGQISTTTKDYIIAYQDLQGITMTPNLALPTLIAICSAALSKPTISSLAILGDITIGGTLVKVENLASTLQVCLDSGAKKILLPLPSAMDLGTVPADLVGAFSLIFYSSPEEAVFKALGVE